MPEEPGASYADQRESTPARGRGSWLLIVGAALVAVSLVGSGIFFGWGLARSGNRAPTVVRELDPGSEPDPSAEAIADRVAPAVVDIYTATAVNPFSGEASREFPRGAGTGMLLTSSGQVLTNNHVVSGATSITVEIDGRSGRFPARVVGASPSSDVALLQIQGVSGLPTVTMGDSDSLETGEEVVAIGNAFGEGAAHVSSGTVSALNRSIMVGDGDGMLQRLSGLIQTTAPIVKGESGGPLIDSSGKVVGMITAARRSQFRDQGSGTTFAIASSQAVRIVNDVRAGRASSSVFIGPVGYVGISVRELDPDIAAQLRLPSSSGTLVETVYSGGPADRAGIPESAVITAIDGKAIESVEGLSPAIHVHKPGDIIRVTWVDGSGTHHSNVTLVAGPAI